jgi:uncharacterized protein
LMYWQAYLHKTSVVAEIILTKILKRAKELNEKGVQLESSKPLNYFLNNKVNFSDFNEKVLDTFAQLDDVDIMGAIKNWQFNDDFVLSSLCKMIINRDLLKIQMSEDKPDKERLQLLKDKFLQLHPIDPKEIDYFVFKGKLKNQAYNKNSGPISIVKKDKTIEDVIEASDQLHLKALSKPVTKYFICFPKVLLE